MLPAVKAIQPTHLRQFKEEKPMFELPTFLTLTASRQTDLPGGLLIHPQAAGAMPSAEHPGKKAGEVLLTSDSHGQPRLVVSLGKAEKVNAEAYRKAGGGAARWLAQHNVALAGVRAADLEVGGVEGALPAFCEGLLLGAFRFERLKTKPEPHSLPVVHLLGADDPAYAALVERAAAIAAGVNLARAWAHEPPNILNPVSLAERAQALAEATGLSCTIVDEKALQQMGANAILAVGLGSQSPSQMILLEHGGAEPASEPLVLVGKAITFDSGGYNLKDGTSIGWMKYDKCGGMAVLGALVAAAQLNLPQRVVGIIAAAENKISAEAYLPSDILTSLSGKTIEITNTDAEGRLVLCDALTYAHTTFAPRAIIDLATLTGGVVVALGKPRAGVMGNDQALVDALLAAGERACERLWQFPLDDDYFELIKGEDSDLKNSSGTRFAAPIVGGIFLKQFVPDETPWAHVDIAGTATAEKDTPYCPQGATGFGVRLVMEYLRMLS
jgi:leucyl aminopeptidase